MIMRAVCVLYVQSVRPMKHRRGVPTHFKEFCLPPSSDMVVYMYKYTRPTKDVVRGVIINMRADFDINLSGAPIATLLRKTQIFKDRKKMFLLRQSPLISVRWRWGSTRGCITRYTAVLYLSVIRH